MFVELVTTGSELLLGEITNYNSAYLSRKLNEIGYSVIYHTTVGDNPRRMEEA
ncbi:competence-damage inducible protein [Megasphaera sp. NM10]|nr:molybdopterin-binding protein [Megasphaera sp. NM10]EPP19025.1 competence-damage inducible protein [Megasphaera sp. NM10]